MKYGMKKFHKIALTKYFVTTLELNDLHIM
jgi:hypothetical protein